MILQFLELFWISFGTGNVLEKILFFRVILELLLNSEFLTVNFLGYNISGYPVWISYLWLNISILPKATITTGLVIK